MGPEINKCVQKIVIKLIEPKDQGIVLFKEIILVLIGVLLLYGENFDSVTIYNMYIRCMIFLPY